MCSGGDLRCGAVGVRGAVVLCPVGGGGQFGLCIGVGGTKLWVWVGNVVVSRWVGVCWVVAVVSRLVVVVGWWGRGVTVVVAV